MELTGQRIINAPRDKVWAAINNPETLARCIPGCEELDALSDTDYEARVNLRVGPVRALFSGKLKMTEIDGPESCVLLFEGSGGAAGFTKGESSVNLTPINEAQTQLEYTAKASVGGKLGQIGGRLINTSAKKLADEFFTALDHELDPRSDQLEPTIIESTKSELGSSTNTSSIKNEAQYSGQLKSLGAQTKQPATPPHSRPAQINELVRVLWFSLGVGTTLLAAFIFS